MKKTVLLVVLAVFLAGCGASPEWITRDYLRAIEEKDGDSLEKLFCDSDTSEASFVDALDYAKLKGIKIEEKKKNKSSAEVDVSGEMKMKLKDDDDNPDWEDFDTTIHLKKQSGDWCIDYSE